MLSNSREIWKFIDEEFNLTAIEILLKNSNSI